MFLGIVDSWFTLCEAASVSELGTEFKVIMIKGFWTTDGKLVWLSYRV